MSSYRLKTKNAEELQLTIEKKMTENRQKTRDDREKD